MASLLDKDFEDRIEYLKNRKDVLVGLYSQTFIPIRLKSNIAKDFEHEIKLLSSNNLEELIVYRELSRKLALELENVSELKRDNKYIYLNDKVRKIVYDGDKYLKEREKFLLELFAHKNVRPVNYVSIVSMFGADCKLIYDDKKTTGKTHAERVEEFRIKCKDLREVKIKSFPPEQADAIKSVKGIIPKMYALDRSGMDFVTWKKSLYFLDRRAKVWSKAYRQEEIGNERFDDVVKAFLTEIDIKLLCGEIKEDAAVLFQNEFMKLMDKAYRRKETLSNLKESNQLNRIYDRLVYHFLGRERYLLSRYENPNIPVSMKEDFKDIYKTELSLFVEDEDVKDMFFERFENMIDGIEKEDLSDKKVENSSKKAVISSKNYM